MTADKATRCGFIAIVGAPNVGKSTLVNYLVGAKVSIVSPKVQTTRTRILGIRMEGDAQLIFVDTPGIFQPRRRLDRAMVAAAWEGVADADAETPCDPDVGHLVRPQREEPDDRPEPGPERDGRGR